MVGLADVDLVEVGEMGKVDFFEHTDLIAVIAAVLGVVLALFS